MDFKESNITKVISNVEVWRCYLVAKSGVPKILEPERRMRGIMVSSWGEGWKDPNSTGMFGHG